MAARSATFTLRNFAAGQGIRVAVKDLINVEGLPTTGGCRALADEAQPVRRDASCLAGTRAARARIVGLTNLHELALGGTGINLWFGTPTNPLDPRLIPGGSSSGSAVAVATDEADIAFGSDTGGSIRVPAACCGVVGLKTTKGRIPLDGVLPLAPTLDTVGPLGRTVERVIDGMALLEPGFSVAAERPNLIGRLRIPTHPMINDAIDNALHQAGFDIIDMPLPAMWDAASAANRTIIHSEALASHGYLAQENPSSVGADVLRSLRTATRLTATMVKHAHAVGTLWRATVMTLFSRVQLLALPTLTDYPPILDHAEDIGNLRATQHWNLAGVPAVAIPVKTDGRLPASLQLVAPANGEESLLAAALTIQTDAFHL